MPVTAETIEKLLKRIDELNALVAQMLMKLDESQKQHEKNLARIEALTKKVEELSTKKARKDSHNSSNTTFK